MINHKALKTYQATQVTTAKPEKILLLLYEGCLKFIRTAKLRLEEKKTAEKGKNISKAIAVVSELVNTLDHSVGSELSHDLEALYLFVIDKLIEANMKNEKEGLEIAERILLTLYEGWQDVINNPRPDGTPSPTLQPELHATFAQAQAKK